MQSAGSADAPVFEASAAADVALATGMLTLATGMPAAASALLAAASPAASAAKSTFGMFATGRSVAPDDTSVVSMVRAVSDLKEV